MAKFAQKIELTDEEKEYLIDNYRRLLKQNNIDDIRKDKPNSWTKLHIREFLLNSLGEEVYFSNSNTVYDNELSDSTLEMITIPANIQLIDDDAFSFCNRIKSVKIDSSCKAITLNTKAFYETPCKILIPKNCNLSLYDTNYSIDFNDLVYLFSPEGNMLNPVFWTEKDKSKRFNLICNYFKIDEGDDCYHTMLQYFKDLNDDLVDKFVFY